MKYIKTFEARQPRKFKEGDIVRWKYGTVKDKLKALPIEIIEWYRVLKEYTVRYVESGHITHINSKDYEIYPPEELAQYYLNKETEKYNL